VFREPRHPYTLALLRSVPDFDVVRERLASIPGAPPDLASPPAGCRFHPRCAFVQEDCLTTDVPLIELSAERAARCLHHDRVALDVRREPVIAGG
jgi:oligopeptide/dipeptide ABC transporter ATP-binding protein